MNCPKCKKDKDRVIDSRSSYDSIRRRRLCKRCGTRWTTYERSEESFSAFKEELRRKLSLDFDGAYRYLDQAYKKLLP
jgi:transcriptional repressor NrdR